MPLMVRLMLMPRLRSVSVRLRMLPSGFSGSGFKTTSSQLGRAALAALMQ